MTQITPEPTNENHQSHLGHRAGHGPRLCTTRSLSLLLCLGALAGVLIWAKLRLVTDIPRSAYADPKDRQVDDARSGSLTDPQTDPDTNADPDADADGLVDESRGDTPQTGGHAEPSFHRP